MSEVAVKVKAEWLVWSHKRDQWWAPNRRGYTDFVDSAGRYTVAEAIDICHNSTRFMAGGHILSPENSILPAPEVFEAKEVA